MPESTSASPVFCHGERIFEAGAAGLAWRVVSGSVRLDRREADGQLWLANLAVAGDIIGAETLVFGAYTFEATALSPCVLTPWPEGDGVPADNSLLTTLAGAERRAAKVLALRYGQALERVRRLVRLLARDGEAGSVVLPSRREMADITALTLETVSRAVSALRQSGELQPQRKPRGVAGPRSFSVAS